MYFRMLYQKINCNFQRVYGVKFASDLEKLKICLHGFFVYTSFYAQSSAQQNYYMRISTQSMCLTVVFMNAHNLYFTCLKVTVNISLRPS